ncbi:hypothetical protein C1H46_035377 [Malus baccata]|uniref:Uncharacterized protein n=1 Tax=Malus baccata TaxID=106549 RepID=A0A540KXW0_MALBA|nr:hypothetical protein C1H46_035377 [Malus baccata]
MAEDEEPKKRMVVVESLGWLTESSIMLKKHCATSGVGASSIIEVKAQLYQSQEESNKRRVSPAPPDLSSPFSMAITTTHISNGEQEPPTKPLAFTYFVSFRACKKTNSSVEISRVTSDDDDIVTLMHGSDPVRVELNRLKNDIRDKTWSWEILWRKLSL